MRSRRGFDWTVGVLTVLGVAVIGVETMGAFGWWWYAAAAAGLAGIVALYVLGYRPVLPEGRPRPWWMGTLLVVCVGVATWGLALIMAIQVAPHVMLWATARRAWTAALGSVAVSAAACLGAVLGTGFGELAPMYVGVNVIALVAALGYGFWIRQAQLVANEQRRLLAELTATQERLEAASRHAGALEERSRVSRELHDTLTQSISGLVLMVAQARRAEQVSRESLETIEEVAREALREARAVVAETATAPASGDAAESILGVVARFRRESALRIETELEPLEIDTERELALVRCTQEGLANVRKHAQATSATVRLASSGGMAQLTVDDDGIGPDRGSGVAGYGLAGMRERVRLLGGTATLANGAVGGATLTVAIPLTDPAHDADATERVTA